MKKIFLPAVLLLFSAAQLDAQAAHHPRTCGVLTHEASLSQQNPDRAAERAAFEQSVFNQANNVNQRNGAGSSTQAVITIPTVVHVLWNTSGQNISNNQVLSQLVVLNQDFTRTNADASQTPAAFQGVAGNPNVQFCLAQQDPNGNFTTGIERRQTTVTQFYDTNDGAKYYSLGGLNAWDPSRYFNIWVCPLDPNVLGYAEFPTGSVSNSFGVVIGYMYFGSNYTSYGSGFNLDPWYNRGRTTTHEIGHCFDLYHIWGDDGSSCSGSDLCADTPNQGPETYGAPSYPQTDNCSTSSPGIMFMNYMDYTDDVAMNLFTVNQVSRMNATLTTAPYNQLGTAGTCQLSSVRDLQSDNLNVTLYPNPSAGKFSLELTTTGKQNFDVTITDALGRTVQHFAELNTYGGTYPVDLSEQPNGVYFIEVSTGSQRTVQRVVISK